jgi:hypothetical protein
MVPEIQYFYHPSCWRGDQDALLQTRNPVLSGPERTLTYPSSTVNLRLAAVRRPAYQAAYEQVGLSDLLSTFDRTLRKRFPRAASSLFRILSGSRAIRKLDG